MAGKGKSFICGSSSGCRCKVGCGPTVLGANEEKPKMCKCGGGQCKILTSKRVQSEGRRFYCCPLSTGPDNHGCGMFAWVTEDRGDKISSSSAPPAEEHPISHCPKMTYSTSLYARGYLDGAIRGSEQQTHALKNVLDALNKLDLNMKEGKSG